MIPLTSTPPLLPRLPLPLPPLLPSPPLSPSLFSKLIVFLSSPARYLFQIIKFTSWLMVDCLLTYACSVDKVCGWERREGERGRRGEVKRGEGGGRRGRRNGGRGERGEGRGERGRGERGEEVLIKTQRFWEMELLSRQTKDLYCSTRCRRWTLVGPLDLSSLIQTVTVSGTPSVSHRPSSSPSPPSLLLPSPPVSSSTN